MKTRNFYLVSFFLLVCSFLLCLIPFLEPSVCAVDQRYAKSLNTLFNSDNFFFLATRLSQRRKQCVNLHFSVNSYLLTTLLTESWKHSPVVPCLVALIQIDDQGLKVAPHPDLHFLPWSSVLCPGIFTEGMILLTSRSLLCANSSLSVLLKFIFASL